MPRISTLPPKWPRSGVTFQFGYQSWLRLPRYKSFDIFPNGATYENDVHVHSVHLKLFGLVQELELCLSWSHAPTK